jgi:type VI secretion system Hcp family effector
MSGYISIPGIKGAVSTSGYEGWIEIDSFKVAAGRELPLVLQGRGQCTVRASEFMIGKLMDSSTPLLFQQICIGRAIPHVQLDLCRQIPQGLQAYVQYNLDNVIFSQYSTTAIRDQNQVHSREWLALNFTGLELRYIVSSTGS